MMFPVHTIPTRMGIEQGIRGQPNRGPGCYSQHPVRGSIYSLSCKYRNAAFLPGNLCYNKNVERFVSGSNG